MKGDLLTRMSQSEESAMKTDQTLSQILEEIREYSSKANPDEARSALLYCLKQLKISAVSQNDD